MTNLLERRDSFLVFFNLWNLWLVEPKLPTPQGAGPQGCRLMLVIGYTDDWCQVYDFIMMNHL